MKTSRALQLGSCCTLNGEPRVEALSLPPHHLATHAVVLGMTGSGKTGLLTVLVEEALLAGVPVLMFDVKGDLPNLLLAFPSFSSEALEPWVEAAPEDLRSKQELASALAEERRVGLSAWGVTEAELGRFANTTSVQVITPGSSAGEPLHVLSSLEHPVSNWVTDPDAARASLSAAVSLVLRLLGRDADPASSRDHVLLSVLAERRLRAGKPSDLGALLADVTNSHIEPIGALPVDRFMSRRDRANLAAGLNTLLASPSFASWRSGVPIDIGRWLTPKEYTRLRFGDDKARDYALLIRLALRSLVENPGAGKLRAEIRCSSSAKRACFCRSCSPAAKSARGLKLGSLARVQRFNQCSGVPHGRTRDAFRNRGVFDASRLGVE